MSFRRERLGPRELDEGAMWLAASWLMRIVKISALRGADGVLLAGSGVLTWIGSQETQSPFGAGALIAQPKGRSALPWARRPAAPQASP